MFGVATQNGVGVGIGNIPSLTTLPYATQLYLAVLALFSSGASGAFLDANDWGPTGTGGTGVVFQDLSGTAVTAMEQPVQLILDKSQGLALGAELVTNGDFSSATGWTAEGGWTISGGSASLSEPYNSGFSNLYQAKPVTAGNCYRIAVDVTARNAAGVLQVRFGASQYSAPITATGTYTFYFFATTTASTLLGLQHYTGGSAGTVTATVDNFSVRPVAGNHAYVSASANRPVISARYNLLLATAVLSTQSVTVGAGSYTLYFTGSGSVALSGAATGTKTAGSNVITCTAGTLTLTVTGSVLTADLRPSDQATGLIPTYQRVNTATDYDWSPAFPPMIRGNGSNQYLTGNLDLSSTNKVTVWAGVRKTSDAAGGVLFELGTGGQTGSVYLSNFNRAGSPSNYYGLLSGGTVIPGAQATASGYAAPITNVVTGQSEIATPLMNLRVNGVQAATNASSQGVGNYGSYPYYLLSRAGASLFWNGGFNSLIILGAAATAAQISTTETWCNSKIKAYA